MKIKMIITLVLFVSQLSMANAKSCIDKMLDEIDKIATTIPKQQEKWSDYIIKLPPPDQCGKDTSSIIKYIAEVAGSEFALEYDKYYAKR